MDAEFIRDLFAEFGPVQVRRMFGGAGVYADGVMFALVTSDILYLKTEPDQVARFAAEGCGPFEYTREGRKATLTSYWRVPDRLYDEPGELAEWARQALTAARRAGVKQKRKR
jgi:DNA transformation protein